MTRLPFPVAAILVCLAVSAALWVPFGAWWPDGGQAALLAAAGACAATAIAAHAIAALARRRIQDPAEMVNAHLIGLMARMFLTLTVALIVMRTKVVPKAPFAIAISSLYALLLALEVFVTLRALRQNHRPVAPATERDDDADPRPDPR